MTFPLDHRHLKKKTRFFFAEGPTMLYTPEVQIELHPEMEGFEFVIQRVLQCVVGQSALQCQAHVCSHFGGLHTFGRGSVE